MGFRYFDYFYNKLQKVSIVLAIFAMVLTMSLTFVALSLFQDNTLNQAQAAAGDNVRFGDYSFGDQITVGGLKFNIVGGHTAGTAAEDSIGMCGSGNANNCADNSAFLALSNDSDSIKAFNNLPSVTGGSSNSASYAYKYAKLDMTTYTASNDYQKSVIKAALDEKFTAWTDSDFTGKSDIIPRTLLQGTADTALGSNCSNSSCSDGNPAKIAGEKWWAPSVNEVNADKGQANYAGFYWLRSPGKDSTYAGISYPQSNNGAFNLDGEDANESLYLRPAMLISLSSLVFKKVITANDISNGYCGGLKTECVQFGNVKFDVIGENSGGVNYGVCSYLSRTDGYTDYTLPGESAVTDSNECPANSAMLLLSYSTNKGDTSISSWDSFWAQQPFNGVQGSSGCGTTTGNASGSYSQYNGSVMQACMETAANSQYNLLKGQYLNNDSSRPKLQDLIITRSLKESQEYYENSPAAGTSHCSTPDNCYNHAFNASPSSVSNQHLFPLSMAEACSLSSKTSNSGNLVFSQCNQQMASGSNGVLNYFGNYYLRSPGVGDGSADGVSDIELANSNPSISAVGQTGTTTEYARPVMFIKLNPTSAQLDQLFATIDSDSESLQMVSNLGASQVTLQTTHQYAYEDGSSVDGVSSADNPTCSSSKLTGTQLMTAGSLDQFISEDNDVAFKMIDCGTDGSTVSSNILTLTIPQKIVPTTYTFNVSNNGGIWSASGENVDKTFLYSDCQTTNSTSSDLTLAQLKLCAGITDSSVGKAYYRFSGWESIDGYPESDTSVILPNLILTATFAPTVNVYLDPNVAGGGESGQLAVMHTCLKNVAPKNDTYASCNLSSNNPDFIPETGYHQTGWSNGALSNLTWQDILDTTLSAQVTYTAQWAINTYQVTFNTNGGSSVASQTVNYGDQVTEPVVNPTKDNADFEGWYKDSGLSEVYDFNTPVISAFTLYAKWKNLTCSNGATNYPDCNNVQPNPPLQNCPNLAINYPDCDNFGVQNINSSNSKSKITISWKTLGNFKTVKVVAVNNYGAKKEFSTTKSSVSFTGMIAQKWTIKIYGVNGSSSQLIKTISENVGLKAQKFTSLKDMKKYNKTYKQAVNWLAKYGITTGVMPGVYAPNNQVTRMQMALFLYRLAGNPAVADGAKCSFDFKDLKGYAKSYKEAVTWLCSTGVTTGTTDTTFAPNNQVTRMQMALFLSRYAKVASDFKVNDIQNGKNKIIKFVDLKGVGQDYKDAINWLVSTGVTKGATDTTYAPSNFVTRMQMALFMYRMCVTASTPNSGDTGLGLAK
ncbi:MAG: S-layer homology domain-containing protein [Candidatus Ancillula sp.]|jgi:uncharacterized repeat protein (TIGR02543 family)|nr:S-layer homology domain-containing protein [Candidatus Ancillula sp.]